MGVSRSRRGSKRPRRGETRGKQRNGGGRWRGGGVGRVCGNEKGWAGWWVGGWGLRLPRQQPATRRASMPPSSPLLPPGPAGWQPERSSQDQALGPGAAPSAPGRGRWGGLGLGEDEAAEGALVVDGEGQQLDDGLRGGAREGLRRERGFTADTVRVSHDGVRHSCHTVRVSHGSSVTELDDGLRGGGERGPPNCKHTIASWVRTLTVAACRLRGSTRRSLLAPSTCIASWVRTLTVAAGEREAPPALVLERRQLDVCIDRDKRRGICFKDESKGKSLEIEPETVRFTCWSTRRARARKGKNGGAVRGRGSRREV